MYNDLWTHPNFILLITQIIYDYYLVTEKINPNECSLDDRSLVYLREYFNEYEKESRMEDFLGTFLDLVFLSVNVHL